MVDDQADQRKLSLLIYKLNQFIADLAEPHFTGRELGKTKWADVVGMMFDADGMLRTSRDFVQPQAWIDELADQPHPADRFGAMLNQVVLALRRRAGEVSEPQAVSDGLLDFANYLRWRQRWVAQAALGEEHLTLVPVERVPLDALLQAAEGLFAEKDVPPTLSMLRSDHLTAEVAPSVRALAIDVANLDPAKEPPRGGGGAPWSERTDPPYPTRWRNPSFDGEPRRYFDKPGKRFAGGSRTHGGSMPDGRRGDD